ncbi:NACHT domain-containing protein [Propioniciclava sinopodophylli]|uniref:NACHT domain-containing protein n=1 Tax=Propioniciclava sinopodophylli TaxID=1837344 RepID=UPI002492B1F9|nr:NACHT domain-containing protein [Propioniciclava sinopodophylli]
MSDPASIATVASATTSLGVPGWKWFKGHINVEPRLLLSGDVAYSATEVVDIRTFMASDECQLLFMMFSLAVLYEEVLEKDASLKVFQTSFESLAKKHCSSSNAKWASSADAIWDGAQKQLRRLLPDITNSPDTQENALLSYFQYTRNVLFTNVQMDSFQERLIELVGDLDALLSTERLAKEVADQSRAAPLSLFSHLTLDKAVNKSDLYIDRAITISDDQEPVPAKKVLGVRPFRLVLLGNPGAGKSTLVEHLRTSHDSRTDWSDCTLLIRCRDYVNEAWKAPLAEFLVQTIERDLSISTDLQALENLLLIGRAVIIFDGLDEIIQPLQRSELRDRILRFAARYPLVSILVTSRPLGYPTASLPEDHYAHVRLAEFTPEQVEQYAQKWFTSTGRPELQESFLREASGVLDITSNPLMLSMLCSLYQADGYIPANRYDVYDGCANLPFSRWDQHRHIDHPSRLNYGPRLMMFIGQQFYIHQSAQAGLDEKQLKKLLSVYLRDHIGVDDPDQSAADFLDFCAERAWLLVLLGRHPKHGVRIFGFAHRTFYEYFAARALARSTSNDGEIAREAVAAHMRDPSSFLPELLIQAADESREGSGSRVFSAAMHTKGVQPSLTLRLMNAPMPARYREEAFAKIAAVWQSSGAGELDVVALAGLNADAIAQLHRVLNGTQMPEGASCLLDTWSLLIVRGRDYLIRGERMQGILAGLMQAHSEYLRSGIPDWPTRSGGGSIASYYLSHSGISGDRVSPGLRPITRGLATVLGFLSPGDVPPLELLMAHNDRIAIPGILPALLRTNDSYFLDLTAAGLREINSHLMSNIIALPRSMAHVIPTVIESGIPDNINPGKWTDDQVCLAIGLERAFRLTAQRDGFLSSVLGSHWGFESTSATRWRAIHEAVSSQDWSWDWRLTAGK